jgi:hypothetical protein
MGLQTISSFWIRYEVTMPGETSEILASDTFFERLEKSLAQARPNQTVSLFDVEEGIIAKIASEHLSAALEEGDPKALLLAIRDVAWARLSPAARPSSSSSVKVLDALGMLNPGIAPQPSDGRWVTQIGSRGRLTLPENLLYEMGWERGDTLLFQGNEPGRLLVRKVVRVGGARR